MENTPLSSDAWDNVTSSSSKDDAQTLYLANIRDLALKIIYIIIGTVGVLDNLFVLVIFILFIRITDRTMNILVVNQSTIDICASFFTLMTAVVEVDGTSMSRDNIYDQFVCRMWLTRTPLWCFLFTSTYGIILMALDRYAAVIYPVWYSSKLNTKKRLVYGAIVFIWVIQTSFVTTMGLLSSDIIGGSCVPWGVYSSYAAERVITSSIFFMALLLPLTLMVFCYSRIVCELRKKVRRTGSSVINTAGRNAVVTSLMVCCGFIVCWTTNQIAFFLNFVGYAIDFAGWFYHFTVVLVFTNSCINPFIYAAKYSEFQNGVRRLISKRNREMSQSFEVVALSVRT